MPCYLGIAERVGVRRTDRTARREDWREAASLLIVRRGRRFGETHGRLKAQSCDTLAARTELAEVRTYGSTHRSVRRTILKLTSQSGNFVGHERAAVIAEDARRDTR